MESLFRLVKSFRLVICRSLFAQFILSEDECVLVLVVILQ